jgi:hypothetical protein
VGWNVGNGRFVSRLWVGSKGLLLVGTCAPVQSELDALGERYARLRALRDAGMTIEALREAKVNT